MIRWLKKLFGVSEDPQYTTQREVVNSIPDDLITQLAVDLATLERTKALAQGYAFSTNEQVELAKEIEHLLRNPGKHKGQIPVRAAMLYEDLTNRVNQKNSSSASSPISDIRVKTNVRPLRRALETATAMRGVEFDWRQEEYPELNLALHPKIGLLAQEVEAVLPTVVRENEEGFKTINYACLVPVLLEAIKEQQHSITKLRDRVSDLEAGSL